MANTEKSLLQVGHRPMAIVPTDMDATYRLAKAVCAAGMTPQGIDTPEKAMVVIMHGMELGLPPMTALQRIAIVNGRPTIWGDAAIGLVRASGLCEYVQERIDGEGDKMVAICEAKRKGEDKPTVAMFSVADAKIAHLWDTREKVTRRGKDGKPYEKANDAPWHQYPGRMLQMRARGFCLRDLFADVLGGLYIREEIDDEREQTAPLQLEPPVPPLNVIVGPYSDDEIAAELEEACRDAVEKRDVDLLETAWDEMELAYKGHIEGDLYDRLMAIYKNAEAEFEKW